LLILDDTMRKSDTARRDAFHAADFAVLCLPDEAAVAAVAMAEGSHVRIIDASSAHRVAAGWTYGFPEIVGRDVVANARRVSNPGCYPTGFIALLAPLVRAGLLPADWPYTVHAVSGFSGGGKALIARFADKPDIAYRAYGLNMGHKHVPEMKAYAGNLGAGLQHDPLFSPAVVPAYRGMVVEIPLNLAAMQISASADDLRAALAGFYANSAVVRVITDSVDELLLMDHSASSDRLDLYVFGAKNSAQVRLIAMLDNLGKGASGAAVQSLNLMAGLPETLGLEL
ncbi:MAG: N-acetyl-gamma-glutamyl-phosphate reductase, partial [Pseudomonadota bacterium]